MNQSDHQTSLPRRIARLLSVLAALALLSLATASPASAATTMTVTSNLGDSYHPGTPLVLVVTISPTQNESGDIVVTIDGRQAYRERVELVAGTASEFLIELTTLPWSSGLQVQFSPSGGGGSVRPDRQLGTQFEPVRTIGVVGSLNEREFDQRPTEIGPLVPVEIPLRWLDADANVMAGLPNLAATGRDLAQLPPSALARVERFINQGGQLFLVDSPDGFGPIPPSGPMGFGDIIPIDGLVDIASLDPVAQFSQGSGQEQFFEGPGGPGGLVADLANDADFTSSNSLTLPSIALSFIALVFASYVVLRRLRLETLYWLILPVLTVATTGALWVVGQVQRSSLGQSHVTILADMPGFGVRSTSILVSSANGGWQSVQANDHWSLISRPSMNQFGELQSSRAERRGDEIGIDLPAGGFGVIRASEAASIDPSFAFDLSGENGTITGTVTNISGHNLTSVAVAAGAGFEDIGHLAAGESATVELTNSDQPLLFNSYLINSMMSFDGVSAGGLTEFMSTNPALTNPGIIVAVGWTADLAAPIGSAESGRTAFFSARRTSELLAQSGDTSTRVTVRTSGFETGQFMVQVILPPGSESVVIQHPRPVTIWTDTGWVETGEGPLEATMIHDGRVWLRPHEEEMWDSGEVVIPRFQEER